MKNLHNALFGAATCLILATSIRAQTAATLSDLGTTAPTPHGPADIYQFANGASDMPDGLNYYTDDGVNNPTVGEPGQTFTTGSGSAGYDLVSIAIQTGGGTQSGVGTAQTYLLHIYAMSGSTVTLLDTFAATNFAYTDGDWLQWSGFILNLSPNTEYAYSFGRDTTGTGWDALQKAGSNPYAGGQIGLFPPAGGTVMFGASGSFDATFDLGLVPGGAPLATTPIVTPGTNVFAGTTVSVTENAAAAGSLHYQWLENGASVPGATNNPLTLPGATTNDSGSYAVIVANSFGASTSAAVALNVNSSTLPIFTQEPTPSSETVYSGGLASFSATVEGSPPIFYQWRQYSEAVPGATGTALILANAQIGQSGKYFLVASNTYGAVTSAPATLNVLLAPAARPSVLTYHYDNTRQGQNTNEFLLNPATLNVNTFGKLFSYAVDGHIYAEPLYVPNVKIPGQGWVNVVYVATEHDSVYAFNADTNTGLNGGLIWSTNLGISAVTPNNDFGNRYGAYHDLTPEMGITGTPVIDAASGTIYMDVFTHEGSSYFHRIHALNITNGAEQPFSPMVVQGSVPGVGVASSGGVVPFVPSQHLQRPALLLAGGHLFVCYSSYADTDPYHGWVFEFNASNLQLVTNGIFNTTPNATTAVFGGNAGEGGLWMGGNGASADASNNIYFQTANGSFSANTNGRDYSDSFMRLTTSNGLAVADYFTPYNQASLAAGDVDLGSGGPLLLPDDVGSATHPHLITGCGKEGSIYVVDRDNMGHYNVNNNNQIVQELTGVVGGTWSSGAYWNHLLYYQGDGDVMKAFAVTNGVFNGAAVTQSGDAYGFPGATPTISAFGTSNGIAWDIQADAYGTGPAILRAYNATNLSQELYNSSMNLMRDNPGIAVKMTVPTVANGKVYMGAEFALSVYGYGVFAATPTITPAGGVYTGSVLVTLSDSTPGTTIYYTLDGTTPTTNSILYTGPFSVTNNVAVHAIATTPGAVSSGVATAGFVNSATLGTGTGLTGQYYANHTAAQDFSGTPTLTRVDPQINFNWDNVGPDPSIGQTTFTVKWTGTVQPQFNETYTFAATADDGTRLFINGKELINEWVDEAATIYTTSVPMVAQQLYNIEMDYYQGGGDAEAQLAWSSPSTPSEIIPQSQLYPYTNAAPTALITSPTNGQTFVAPAAVTIVADVDAQFNAIGFVDFYVDGLVVAKLTNAPYTVTLTGLTAGTHSLLAEAVDGSGLKSADEVVEISVAAGSGEAYGVTTRAIAPAFYNMPQVFTGHLPDVLSETGVFSNTPSMTPASSLIPYAPIAPLWSDGAVKTRYMSVPNNRGADTPDQQIGFAPTGEWTFPSGTVFVKTFQLITNTSDPSALRRLETRLLVRDTNGAVYGVTYKWRADNGEADLLTTSLTEPIAITTPAGVVTQNWYYPSPADCLSCHTAVANYVLGVKTRQLNTSYGYPSGVTGNELRTLNSLGLFNPSFSEASISTFTNLVNLTNLSASLESRARSYIDANCAQCHRPGGTGTTFDARYDTPLANQNIINAAVIGNLGYDNAAVIVPHDVWRSIMYDRMNTVDPAIRMPPLARNTIDPNAVAVMAQWINSLGGAATVAPPAIAPAGGIFTNSVTVTLQPPDQIATLRYTLDGTTPTTNSSLYAGPLTLTESGIVKANAFEAGYVNSVATTAAFTIVPPLYNLFAPTLPGDGTFEFQYWAPPGTYVLQGSTDLVHWTPLNTNVYSASPFYLVDPGAGVTPYRFYRVQQQ